MLTPSAITAPDASTSLSNSISLPCSGSITGERPARRQARTETIASGPSGARIATLAPGAFVGVLAGYLLAAKVSDAAVGLAVGIISIGFALRRMLGGNRSAAVATKARWGAGSVWGVVCGFTSMIAHAGGPPFQIYVMPQKLPPAVFVGTGAIFFAAMNLVKVIPYVALGQFSAQNLTASAALLPVAVAATFAGVWLVRRVPAERFYTYIYWLLLLVGAKLVLDGLHGLHILG